MSAVDYLAAVVAAIRAEGGVAYSVAQVDAVTAQAGKRPEAYNEVHVLDMTPTNARMGDSGDRHFRVLVRTVARYYGDALEQREKARAALLDRSLTVSGAPTGALRPSIDDEPIGPDDGWYSGVSEYAFSA